MQVPDWHVSDCVHLFPSSHEVPFAFAGFEHVPVPESHVPALWHWSCAVHVTGLLPVHFPCWQVSVRVHAFPSLHAVPSALSGFEHVPLPLSHTPTLWHWSLAVHVTGLPPVHVPAWHVSVCVHASPSSHFVPLALALHAVALVAGVHCWQALLGFTAFAA